MPSQEDLHSAADREALIKDLVKTFKLLSDETRLRILYHLSNASELHVRGLCDLLGQSQPAVSHHLAMLRASGVVEPRREGKHNFYRILPGRFQQLLDIIFEKSSQDDHPPRFGELEPGYRPPVRPK